MFPFFLLCMMTTKTKTKTKSKHQKNRVESTGPMIYPLHTDWAKALGRSIVQQHHQKVLPTQMCAYSNLNMLYHHQRNEIYIFMYIVIVVVVVVGVVIVVHCALYSTTPNTFNSRRTSSATGSLSLSLPLFLILCAFLLFSSFFFIFCDSWFLLCVLLTRSMKITLHKYPKNQPLNVTRWISRVFAYCVYSSHLT